MITGPKRPVRVVRPVDTTIPLRRWNSQTGNLRPDLMAGLSETNKRAGFQIWKSAPVFYSAGLKTQLFQDLAEFNLLPGDQFVKFSSDQKVGFDHAVFKIAFEYRILNSRQ